MNTLHPQSLFIEEAKPHPLPAATRIEYARFRVRDLERSLPFYTNLLGLVPATSEDGTMHLAPTGSSAPLVKLMEESSAPAADRRSPGLFHMALLYPNRRALAAIFKKLYLQRWPFQGFADHGVSEALYLADAEGNGIELYVDRPRELWPYKDGKLQMVTDPLNLDGLLAELNGDTSDEVASSSGMTIGHMHLQVSGLHQAEEFYHRTLGFDVVQRDFPGALFMSAGGYHHHIGVNIWNSRGARPRAELAAGLMEFGIRLGDPEAANRVSHDLRSTPFWGGEEPDAVVVRDADHIQVHIS